MSDAEEEEKSGRPPYNFIRTYFEWLPLVKKSKCIIGNCGMFVMGQHAENLERHIMRNHPRESEIIRTEKLNIGQKRIIRQEERKRQKETSRTPSREASTSSELRTPSPAPARPPKRRKGIITIEMTVERFRRACRDLVTIDGRPFSALDDTGFRQLADPIVEGLRRSYGDNNIDVNRRNVQNDITETASSLRRTITEEVAGRLICLKLDCASRLDRQLLSINAQYVRNGKLVLRNMCMKELLCSHTAVNPREEVLDILRKFGIIESQIYTCTTDNAANMLKMVSLMKNASPNEPTPFCECAHTAYAKALKMGVETTDNDKLNSPESSFCSLRAGGISEDETDEESETDASGDEGSLSEATDDSDSETLVNQQSTLDVQQCTECAVLHDTVRAIGVTPIRCSAHTLQLAVADALKLHPDQTHVINKARKLCKKLRTPTIAKILKDLKLKKPPLDVVTRWHSLYDMLDCLLKSKDACALIDNQLKSKRGGKSAKQEGVGNLTESDWSLVSGLCKAFGPARNATKKLQAAQLTAGDFYDIWLSCKIQTEAVASSIALDVVSAMEIRENNLLCTPAFCAAIYMDMRYHLMLSTADKDKAKSHLEALWKQIQRLRETSSISPLFETAPSAETLDVEMEDPMSVCERPLQRILKQKDKERRDVMLSRQKSKEILAALEEMESWQRLPFEANILSLWEDRKISYPLMYELAVVVLALPMTQVSVKRTFSHLRQILSVLRCSMKSDIMDDILLIRCNHYFKDDNSKR